jgi:indole-3-glycerol phosphate synthase
MIQKIIADKKEALERFKKRHPLEVLKEKARNQKYPRDLYSALNQPGLSLIAEIKPASPSAGVISRNFDPVKIAWEYLKADSAAISVLTEEKYFLGKPESINLIKSNLGNKCPPIIRKDFIFDSYQITESRALGADAILLIAATLSLKELEELIGLSKEYNLQCLVEVHNESEIDNALNVGSEIIGINNRNLKTMEVDKNITNRLRNLIPPGIIVVSESGINSRRDLDRLRELKVDAVLIGEELMRASDIKAKIKEMF